MQHPLDLVEQLLALAPVQLARLPLEEVLDLGYDPGGIGVPGWDGPTATIWIRDAALPEGPRPPKTTPLSLPSCQAEKKAARSMVRILTRMPAAVR